MASAFRTCCQQIQTVPYTTMRLFLVNLLAVTMLIMPMYAWVSLTGCDCVEDSHSGMIESSTAGSAAQLCCTPLPQAVESQSNQSLPCDSQDCPASCCTGTVVSAFDLPAIPKLIIQADSTRVTIPVDGFDRSSPHLLRLKRPPRTA